MEAVLQINFLNCVILILLMISWILFHAQKESLRERKFISDQIKKGFVPKDRTGLMIVFNIDPTVFFIVNGFRTLTGIFLVSIFGIDPMIQIGIVLLVVFIYRYFILSKWSDRILQGLLTLLFIQISLVPIPHEFNYLLIFIGITLSAMIEFGLFYLMCLRHVMFSKKN